MNKITNYIACFSFGFLIGWLMGIYDDNSKYRKFDDSLRNDSIIRDSIYIKGDSIEKEIIYLEKQYEEKVDSIINSDDSTQVALFTKYVEDFNRTNKDS